MAASNTPNSFSCRRLVSEHWYNDSGGNG